MWGGLAFATTTRGDEGGKNDVGHALGVGSEGSSNETGIPVDNGGSADDVVMDIVSRFPSKIMIPVSRSDTCSSRKAC